jgi:hypothetical protein
LTHGTYEVETRDTETRDTTTGDVQRVLVGFPTLPQQAVMISKVVIFNNVGRVGSNANHGVGTASNVIARTKSVAPRGPKMFVQR